MSCAASWEVSRVADTGNAPVLQAVGLRKEFGELVAVDDVSFDLPPGRSLAIVGESGSGKTTIARMIVGLERPTNGTITACGHERSRPARSTRDRRRRGREVQIVFQDPYTSLDPRQTAEATIDEVLRLHHGWPADRRQARTAELIDLVGLDTRQSRALPRSLSGGQRQRVAIARALAAQPEILILDESVAALDVSIQAQVLNLLADLQREYGLTYLFIAHDLEVVRHVSTSVNVMYLGKIAEAGPKNLVYDTPRHPYTAALLSAAPAADPEATAARQRIILTGDIPSPIDPPAGCRFHPRCPKARDRCGSEEPPLEVKAGDAALHLTACHFPVTADDKLATTGRRAQP
jgi:oligopeptide/dipeptide ABC transporter ATP-binding protein